MPHQTHHLFFSYSRLDNKPRDGSTEGWITAFYKRLQAQHQLYTGRELRIFFDTEEIDHGSDWKARLGQGLRTSNLFLAFLSPNYMRSKNCRWEWEEYLRREHSLARGDDGIRTVFFEIVPGMPGISKLPDYDEGKVQALEKELRADQEIARWLDMVSEEFRRRNNYLDQANALNPRATFVLQPWFSKGPQILAELDASERLAQLRANPQSDKDKIVDLAERLKSMDEHIAARLDRCLLADLAPGRFSLGRTYPHFVGRHRELRELHQSLISDKVGVVTAVHGLGGQGKTALAVQYAHAYADFYAAGGRWLVPCEGVNSLADALMRLAGQAELRFDVPKDVQNEPDQTIGFVLMQLERYMEQNAERIMIKLRQDKDRMSSEENLPQLHPRALVIFDNVDHPNLVSAEQLKLLPQSEWFELVVTTRLDPEKFGVGKDLRPIAVDALPIDDAIALIRDFQPNQQFPSPQYEEGVKRLCEELGCFTLAVEIVGAFLAEHPEVDPNDYCDRLAKEGISTAEEALSLGGVSPHVRHREKQLSIVTDWTLSKLDEQARFVLDHAAILEPDSVIMDWLREIAAKKYPALRDVEAAREKAIGILKELLSSDLENSSQSSFHLLDDPNHAPEFIRAMHTQLEGVPEQIRQSLEPLFEDAMLPRKDFSKPDEWAKVWRQLSGLRLLTEGAERPVIKEGEPQPKFSVPAVVKIHRLVAAHVQNRMDESSHSQAVKNVAEVFDKNIEDLGAKWQHDASVFWLIRPFADNAIHLAKNFNGILTFAKGCGILGDAELEIGSLANAQRLIDQCVRNLRSYDANHNFGQDISLLTCCGIIGQASLFIIRDRTGDSDLALALLQEANLIAKKLAQADPDSYLAINCLCSSAEKLGNSYLERGNPGDAELALLHFQESLETARRMLVANPNSSRTRRDLSVPLVMLADFYSARGMPGDSDLVFSHLQEAHNIAIANIQENRNSIQALGDLNVSLTKLGDFLLARGIAGDAELALGHYQEAHTIAVQITNLNPASTQALRCLSIAHEKLSDFYKTQFGSAQSDVAIEHANKSHELCRKLVDMNPDSAQAQRDLNVSLINLGELYLTRRNPVDQYLAIGLFEEALKLAKKLADANPDSAQALRDLSVSLSTVGGYYLARGEKGDAELALVPFKESHRLLKQIAGAIPNTAQALRDLSVSLEKLGSLYLARGKSGDAELALGHFQESLEISRQIAEANPNSALALRALSVSLDRLGVFYLARGKSRDAELALGHFQESLDIRRQIAEANPNSAQALRDLSVSLDRLGDFYLAQGKSGDAELALGHFQESHRLLKQIAEANPNSAQALRDLSVSLDRVGDFYLARGKSGDVELALGHFQESLDIRRLNAKANPNSAQALCDVSASLDRLGGFYLARGKSGDAELALGHFQESHRLLKQIAEANPNSAQALPDLSVSLNKLGGFYLSRGKPGDAELALGHFQESLDIARQIAVAAPNSAQALRDLSVSLNKLGDFYLTRGKSGDAELALGHFQESHQLLKQIAEANPNSAQALRDLLVSMERLSDILGSMESDDAKKNSLALQIQALEIALNLHQSNPGNLYLGRTAAITAIRAYEKSRLVGEDNLSGQCLGVCYTVLQTLVDNGCQLDEQTEQTYQQLKQAFTQGK